MSSCTVKQSFPSKILHMEVSKHTVRDTEEFSADAAEDVVLSGF